LSHDAAVALCNALGLDPFAPVSGIERCDAICEAFTADKTKPDTKKSDTKTP